MSLLDIALAKVADLDSHLKALAEHEVPALEALQGSKIVQAIEGFVLTPEAEQFIADTVGFLASKYGQPAAAATDPTTPAPADPVDPAAAPAA